MQQLTSIFLNLFVSINIINIITIIIIIINTINIVITIKTIIIFIVTFTVVTVIVANTIIITILHYSIIGAGRSSRGGAFAHGAIGRGIDPSWGRPIELFLVPWLV